MRLPFAELSAEELELRQAEGRPVPNLQLVIANSPELAHQHVVLLRTITSGMPARLAELVILRQAALAGNTYCWGHHVPVALELGWSAGELRGIRDGDLSSLHEDDRLVAEYVAAVVDRSVTDGGFVRVRALLGDQLVVNVTMLVGCYAMSGMAQAAFEVAQDPGFGGFEAP